MSRQPKSKRTEATAAARVRPAHIPSDLTYERMSEMGRALFDLSREYERAGGVLLDEDGIEHEIARRRGGYAQATSIY